MDFPCGETSLMSHVPPEHQGEIHWPPNGMRQEKRRNYLPLNQSVPAKNRSKEQGGAP